MMRDLTAPAQSVGAAAEPSGDGGPRGGIFSSLRAHPLLIAFGTLLTVVTTLAVSAARESTYDASAQILVTPIPESERSLPHLPLLRASSDRTRVVQTAANLLDSPAAAQLAAEQLGPGWTADRVAAATDILPEGESDILAVIAEAEDPEVAAQVANAFAQSTLVARREAVAPILESRIRQLERELEAEPNLSAPAAVDLAERLATLRSLRSDEGDPTFSLTQRAEAPTSAAGPSPLLLVIVSILAGFALSLGIAIVVDMLSPRRVEDVADAVGATGVPVLARVPALPFWLRPSPRLRLRPASAAALRRLQHQLELQPGAPRRLLFVGGSRGDGVTTSVGELGLTLARAGRDVLLMDLNTRKPQLARRVGAPDVTPLATVLAAGGDWESATASVPDEQGLTLLAVGAQGPLGIPDDVAADLLEVLATARERFDYVLIDAPPLTESGDALRVTSDVDAVVLVLRPGKTRMVDLESVLAILEQAQWSPAGLLLVGGRAATAVTIGAVAPASTTEPLISPATNRPTAATSERANRPIVGKTNDPNAASAEPTERVDLG
jgi:Mrp family chromosome partitioning ATPase